MPLALSITRAGAGKAHNLMTTAETFLHLVLPPPIVFTFPSLLIFTRAGIRPKKCLTIVPHAHTVQCDTL